MTHYEHTHKVLRFLLTSANRQIHALRLDVEQLVTYCNSVLLTLRLFYILPDNEWYRLHFLLWHLCKCDRLKRAAIWGVTLWIWFYMLLNVVYHSHKNAGRLYGSLSRLLMRKQFAYGLSQGISYCVDTGAVPGSGVRAWLLPWYTAPTLEENCIVRCCKPWIRYLWSDVAGITCVWDDFVRCWRGWSIVRNLGEMTAKL